MQKHPVIGIVLATFLEAKPFLADMAFEKIEKHPFPVFRKENEYLIVSGIGKANAAMATFHLCQGFTPDVIVNVGAAGASGDSAKLGEFLHLSLIIEYDRPHVSTGQPFSYKPLIIPGFRTVRAATQDKPVLDPGERKAISLVADLVEMEAASVIQAASKFNIPAAFFKYVTDTPDHTDEKDIVHYIREYRDPFHQYFMATILPRILERL